MTVRIGKYAGLVATSFALVSGTVSAQYPGLSEGYTPTPGAQPTKPVTTADLIQVDISGCNDFVGQSKQQCRQLAREAAVHKANEVLLNPKAGLDAAIKAGFPEEMAKHVPECREAAPPALLKDPNKSLWLGYVVSCLNGYKPN